MRTKWVAIELVGPEVPLGATYPLDQAPQAVAALMGHHPYGTLALITKGDT